MKYIKLYEQVKEPKIGDYVICQDNAYDSDSPINIYLYQNIGVIIEKENISTVNFSARAFFKIKYSLSSIPSKILYMFIEYGNGPELHVFRKEIIHFSENEEDLKVLIAAKKYNI